MGEFLITRWVAGSADEISITEPRYHRICNAQDGILFLTVLEERLALVLETYIELEEAVFSHGLRWLVHRDWRWESRRDQVFVLNRRLLALLNACRMYFDHADGELKRRRSVPQELEAVLRKRLKSVLSARSLLALQLLRNYCQHQRLGFEGVGVTNSRYMMARKIPASSGEERVVTTAVLSVKVADVRVTRNHPTKKILDELRDLQIEEWDPGPDLREGIDELTLFHSQMKEGLAEISEDWKTELTAVINQARDSFGNVLGLCVVNRLGRGNYGRRVEVFSELLSRLEELENRNGKNTSLADSMVTTTVPIEKAPNKSLQRTREARR